MQRLFLIRLAFAAALIFTFVMAVLPKPPEVPIVTNDKLQHMAAFATLSVLGIMAFPGRIAAVVIGLVMLGAAIEVIQAIPALHRSSDWRDLVADLLAIAVATALSVVVLRMRRRNPR